MSVLTGPSRSTQAYFWLFVVVVLAANILLAGPLAAWHGAPVLEWPVGFDLLLLLPGAYLWVYRKRGRQALVGALALFGSGVFIGSLIVPAGSQHVWPWLVQLRYVLLAAALATQVVLIVMMLREVLRARTTRNLELAVDETLTRRLGTQGMVNLFRLEARMWLYALLRRPVRHPFPGSAHFYGHRQQGNASNQLGFLMLMAVEMPVMHLILHWMVSPLAALVVTALSVYGFIFMLAEYRATLHRPTTLDGDQLRIRYGIAGDIALPLARIAVVSRYNASARRAPGRMRFIGMGAANVRLELLPGTRVTGLLGEREVETILLGLDEPGRFIACVHPQDRA